MIDHTQSAVASKLMAFMTRIGMVQRPPALEEWASYDLTMVQLRALGLLHDGPRRMSDIAGFLGIGLPSATSVITRLETKGLVERIHDPGDRRVVTCSLTPRGKDQIEALWRVQIRSITDLVAHMTEKEQQAVLTAMDVLMEAADRLQAAGAPPAGGRSQIPSR